MSVNIISRSCLVLMVFLNAIYVKAGVNQSIQNMVNARSRPNVLIILSDDQGYGDFSCHGNPVLETPALDKLYNEGLRFSNFHVSPLCTPTRGQLMSGLDAVNNKASKVLSGLGLMRRDITIMPEIFRDNGYVTGIFGKWHLGDVYPDRPMDRGFQKCIWIKGWGILSETEFDNDYYKTRYLDSLQVKYSDKYCTDLWFDASMKWMDEMSQRRKPFFAYLALNAPHGPFFSPREEAKKYRGKVGDSSAASFLGMVSNIDKNMARLDKWLIEKNLKNNTLLIFMTDNGGTGGVKVYNAGMRGEKQSLYDGGHRAACFINWPAGNFQQPRTIDCASEVQDLLPTFMDLLGFKPKLRQAYDGKSLKNVLTNPDKNFTNRMFVVQYTGNDQEKPRKYFSCVVWDNWRLVGENELYDISKDTGQIKNIAANYPDVLGKMKDYYEKWWVRLQPELSDYVPVIVGNQKENPTLLTSNGWIGVEGVNSQWNVAMAKGTPQGGSWLILAEASGTYRLELSRWPPHLKRLLTAIGPDAGVGGTWIRPGKAVPIVYGCISLNHGEPVIKKAGEGADKIVVELKMNKGKNILQAWFRDKDNKDNCAAYYVQVERLQKP